MRIEFNAYFRAHPFTGSGQYLNHLSAALRRGFPNLTLIERQPSNWLRGRLGKVIWEQAAWLRGSAAGGSTVRHAPYLAHPLAAPGCVVTAHDAIPYVLRAYGAGAGQRLYGMTVRMGLRRARLVIADSDWTRRDLIRSMHVRPDRIRVIPLGVDDRFAPANGRPSTTIRARHKLPERFALYLGSLDLRKNLGVLVRAWPRIWADAAVPLVVAGRAPRTGSQVYVDWFSGLGAESAPWLHAIGPVAEADKPDLYRAATLFVFPSRYEGFGLDPLEAMASGVPVVAAAATSVPEVVGDAGVLLPPDDADAWAAAVASVIGDRAHAQRLAAAGIDRAREFSWDRTATMTHEVYREAAG